ncbi:MAG: hypothetical protein JST40_01720 [Armatimonadetes bacterium]|nr:hypothetical protein [Armatimonadota bacterium]
MNRTSLKICAAFIVVGVAAGSLAEFKFELLKPGTWQDNSSKCEGGINNAGVVGGFSSSGGNWRDTAVRWISDTPSYQTLPAPYEARGNAFNYATGINSAGIECGYTFDGVGWTDDHQFPLWWDTANIGHTLPGGAAHAWGINDLNDIVGGTLTEAFKWRIGDAALTLLGNPVGATNSVANDISESGLLIVGHATVGAAILPYKHSGGTWISLPLLAGYSQGKATRVLNDGTVFGKCWTTTETTPRAVAWSASGQVSDLGTLGGQYSEIYWANSKGDVVGISTNASGTSQAFLKPFGKPLSNLTADLAAKNWVIFRMGGINDTGVISGFGYVNGGTPLQSFRATPQISGTVNLNEYLGDVAGQVVSVEVGTESVGTATLDAAGNFTIPSGGFVGNYQVFVKGSHWLRRASAPVNIGPGGVSGLTFDLINGDIDNDNMVTVFDYVVLSEYFDRTSDDADWNAIGANGSAPKDADLDGDGAITIFDYVILSDNFDMFGD